jgi:hypothetical protein
VGVHYLGDCGEDGIIPTVLRGLGVEGRVQFRQLNPDGFDKIVTPDFDWSEYQRRPEAAFPDDRRLREVDDRPATTRRGSPTFRRQAASHDAHSDHSQNGVFGSGTRGTSTGTPHSVSPVSNAARTFETACRCPACGNHRYGFRSTT